MASTYQNHEVLCIPIKNPDAAELFKDVPQTPHGSGQVRLTFDGGSAADWTQQPVPEPATMLLVASGLIGLVGFRKRFRKR
jgi:hypothetical protein